MDANIRSAHALFFAPGRYLIPIYQRPYVWDEAEQWDPLWEDVERTAEQFLDPDFGGSPDHFLGAIVLQAESVAPGEMPRWLVIDGQQRLLTLQLLLDAAELVLANLGDGVRIQRTKLRSLIENPEAFLEPLTPHGKFKVWPTVGDQDQFRQAMSQADPDDVEDNARIRRAHKFFREQVLDWVTADADRLAERANALEVTLSQKLKIVAIDLSAQDNPNVIFETLNARGTPLLDWDLTKNYLIHHHQLAGGSDEHLHREHFAALEQDDWWRKDVRRGSLYVPRIDAFLYHWMVLRTCEEIRTEQVFPDFMRYAKGKNAADIAVDLQTSAAIYKRLMTDEDDTQWGIFLKRWRALQAGVVTPHLMWLAAQRTNPESVTRVLAVFDSYFTRRTVCRIPTTGLNVDLLPLLTELQAAGPAHADQTVIEFFASRHSPRTAYPGDDSFRESLRSGRMYRQLTRARTLAILEALNTAMFNHLAPTLITKNLFIEHVMPQKWETHYPLSHRSEDGETPLERRQRLLHTIGNLSLTTDKLGIKMGADAWSVKRAALKSHDTLPINEDLLRHAGNNWTDDDIEARGERLADLALEVWPSLERI